MVWEWYCRGFDSLPIGLNFPHLACVPPEPRQVGAPQPSPARGALPRPRR